MNKIAALVVCLLLCGCDQSQQQPSNGEAVSFQNDVKFIEVGGHSYLRFERMGAHGTSIAVVHSPDCQKCFRRMAEMESSR